MLTNLSEIYPNGASSHQLEELREYVFKNYGNPYTSGIKWPIEIQRLMKQKDAISMLQSVYAYHGYHHCKEIFMRDKSSNPFADEKRSYYEKYYDEYKELGGTLDEYDTFINIQITHYKRSQILVAVHTDSEGVSYNSIKESDEICNL